MELKVIKDNDVAAVIHGGKVRAVYAAPGVTDTVAGALIKVRKRIGRNRIWVVLDGSANALRLGYGQTHPMRHTVKLLQDLIDQVTDKVMVEHVTLYLTKRLEEVFLTAESVVGNMKLKCVRKGVTYETLASSDFQKKVRDAFPHEDWNKPFSEFTAAKAEQLPLLNQ